MRYTAFYLIEPRPSLRGRLAPLDDADFQDLLLEPVMLSKEQGGRTVWMREDYALTVKLVFLASLKQYDVLQSDTMFEELFGSARLNVQLFDRWWTIRELDDESEESLYPLLAEYSHLVDQTDNDLVNQWLEQVRTSQG
jgi:hypothetical protein